jgi:hypothetical protein
MSEEVVEEGTAEKLMGALITKMPDLFRGDAAYDILKDETAGGISIPENNQEFHEMDWADIHRLAEEAKGTGNLGNNMGME